MIQRIQSLYFILSSLFQAALLWIPFGYFFNVNETVVMTIIGGTWNKSESLTTLSPDIAVLLTGAFVLLASLASLVSFKNRKLQVKISWIIILVSFLEIVLMLNFIFNGQGRILLEKGYTLSPLKSIGLIFPVLVVVFIFLAIKAIKDDENLVRSIDRIR